MPLYNHVGPYDSSRRVRIRIEADLAGGSSNELFKDTRYASSVTANDKLAQTRMDYVVMALHDLAVVDSVKFVDDSHGATASADAGPALEVEFTTEKLGTLTSAADITDTIGVGNGIAKTRKGLQSLVDALATVSFDGGTTGPFGALSAGGAVTNEDGTTTAGAPDLSGAGTPSGLRVYWLG